MEQHGVLSFFNQFVHELRWRLRGQAAWGALSLPPLPDTGLLPLESTFYPGEPEQWTADRVRDQWVMLKREERGPEVLQAWINSSPVPHDGSPVPHRSAFGTNQNFRWPVPIYDDGLRVSIKCKGWTMPVVFPNLLLFAHWSAGKGRVVAVHETPPAGSCGPAMLELVQFMAARPPSAEEFLCAALSCKRWPTFCFLKEEIPGHLRRMLQDKCKPKLDINAGLRLSRWRRRL